MPSERLGGSGDDQIAIVAVVSFLEPSTLADTVLNAQSTAPAPIYNRAGTTVDAYVGGPSSVPTPINRQSQRTVVVFSDNGSGTAITLPSGSDVGDEVLFFYDSAHDNGPTAFPPSGEQFYGGAISGISRRYFMKVSSSSWGAFV